MWFCRPNTASRLLHLLLGKDLAATRALTGLVLESELLVSAVCDVCSGGLQSWQVRELIMRAKSEFEWERRGRALPARIDGPGDVLPGMTSFRGRVCSCYAPGW